MVWGQEIRHLVEIYAGDEVSSNVTAGNRRVENEEEKDLQSLLHKLHHTQTAHHCKSELFLQFGKISWRNWIVGGVNFSIKGDCYQM